ncbi:MAG: endonuclease dU [Candidatus Heimdallarchaeaceae archaeon]
MKSDIRTIGIDDAAFNRKTDKTTPVFGVIVRGNHVIEGILQTQITIDGLDATEKISKMIIASKYYTQLKAIFFASSTIAAFNIIEIPLFYEITQIPIIVILQKLPNDQKTERALIHFEDSKKRLSILKANPPYVSITFRNRQERLCKGFVQYVGLDKKSVSTLLSITSYMACVPECLRIADLIGRSFRK